MTPAFIVTGFDLAAIEPGDQVELKSGGLPLTVLSYCSTCGDVDVAYTDSEGDIDILTLPAAALKPYVEDEDE